MINNNTSTYKKYSWILILIVTFIAYIPVLNAKFLAWDDDIYILNNPMINGFNFDNIKLIFSNYYYGLYHPLTILTWNIEHSFVEFSPWLYHFNNVLIHLINTYLVFIIFKKYIFKNNEIAIIVSALFGVASIHVESVAWITERKDVLYTLFYLIALIQYVKFKQNNNYKYYFIALFTFILSLLSKGMAITLPIVFILIDYLENKNIFNLKLIIEKIPFFIMSLFFGVINILAQKDFFGNKPNPYNFFEQIGFSSYAYMQYIIKTIIPYKLSAFYPYPKQIDELNKVIYGLYTLILISIISLSIWLIFKNKRKIVFGIIFFTINIVFVLQLFMHNTEAILSDRYPYLASIGLFFIFGLLYKYIKENYNKYNSIIKLTFYLVIFLLAINTYNRSKVWKNDLTLFTDVLNKYPNAQIAANNIGIYYLNNNNINNAIEYFTRAININPNYSDSYSNRGSIYYKQNKLKKALLDLNKAIQINKNNSAALQNRGNIYYAKKDFNKALDDYNKAIEINPNNCKTYINRGLLFCEMQKISKAKNDFDFAKLSCPKLRRKIDEQIKPFLELYNKTGVYYGQKGNYDKALEYFNMALTLNPDFIDAKQNILYAKKIMNDN